MASRATGYLRRMLSRVGGDSSRRFASTATPAMSMVNDQTLKPWPARGDFVPVCVALGMIMLSATIGLYTAKQHLVYAPDVFVSKKRRETFPEISDPDYVVDEAEKYFTKSLFRRVALPVPDLKPVAADPIQRRVHVETLKSVGVEAPKL